jgi:RHS repeat-associated protein
VAEYEYDAWGNILSQTGSLASENPYRYAGYRYDEVTGLYYLMSRYYDANIGRFLTRDTFHGFGDEPQSLNQYAYAHNNPVMNIDPDGHFAQRVLWNFLKGGALNSWDIVWNFYKKHKFNWNAWKTKFPFKTWARAFVVGGVTEVTGIGWSKALKYAGVSSKVALAINWVRTEAQKYLYNTLSRGEPLSVWDLITSLANARLGKFGTFLDTIGKI